MDQGEAIVSATFLETPKESLWKERKKWGGAGKVNMSAGEEMKRYCF